MKTSDRILGFMGSLICQAMVIGATLLSLFPVYFMIVSAFKTRFEYIDDKWGLPQSLYWANFNTVLAGEKFFIRFANSSILTVGSVFVSLIIACLAAYAFARMEFYGKRTLFNIILSLMVVPPAVMIVPLFVAMVRWKLVNTYHGTIFLLSLLPESGLDVCESFSQQPLTSCAFEEAWQAFQREPLIWGAIPSTWLEEQTPQEEFEQNIEHLLAVIERPTLLGIVDLFMSHNSIERVAWIAQKLIEWKLSLSKNPAIDK